MADALSIVGIASLFILGFAGVVGGVIGASRRYLVMTIIGTIIAIAMMIAGWALAEDSTREECAVVGTNAEDATYVCVEVTE